MSDAYKLLEKITLDELKTQRDELRTNTLLPVYLVIMGIFITQSPVLYKRYLELKNHYIKLPLELNILLYFWISFLIGCLSVAGYFIYLQLGVRKDRLLDAFAVEEVACKIELEERGHICHGEISGEIQKKIDSVVEDIIRLRLMVSISEVINKLRHYNRERQIFQRWTTFSLLMATATVAWMFMSPP